MLQGVIAVGDQRTAMLKEKATGRIFRVDRGKDVNGIVVESIEPTEVTLAMGGERESLALMVQRPDGKAVPAAPAGAAPAEAAGPFGPAAAPAAAPGAPAAPQAPGTPLATAPAARGLPPAAFPEPSEPRRHRGVATHRAAHVARGTPRPATRAPQPNHTMSRSMAARFPPKQLVLSAAAAAFATSCSLLPPSLRGTADQPAAPTPATNSLAATAAKLEPPVKVEESVAKVYPGNGNFVNMKPYKAAEPAGPEEASLNFEALDVREVAKVILGDYLKQSYTVHPERARGRSPSAPCGRSRRRTCCPRSRCCCARTTPPW